MTDRWKMNRLGFINFWLYDNEVFPLDHGHILLRGQNGSGKSITTQSFIRLSLTGIVHQAVWIRSDLTQDAWITTSWEMVQAVKKM